MSSTWDEASKCPADGTTGKVVAEKIIERKQFEPPQGKLITLECNESRCQYYDVGWTVQVRPDGTIPDPVTDRPKQYHKTTLTEARKQMLRDLAAQVAQEQRPGTEVRSPYA